MRLDAELPVWEGERIEHWRAAWRIPELHIVEITASTNDDARRLGEVGSPNGTVVIAERQSAGRGQHGRSWYGTAGRSLHFSLLLRAPAGPLCLSAAPVRVGLLACRALADVTGLTISLKWPNDLQFEGRKIGGILCESVLDPELLLIVGIGINVTQQEDDFPPEIRATASSLAAASNRVMQRAPVAGALATALAPKAAVMAQPFSDAELEALAEIDALSGRAVDVDGEPAGIAERITAEGCLLVRRDGSARELHSGTVRLSATP
jgi:BirA family biotin operon repressor/biotin-[acetyl-CoA-carboxylase] ligase